MDVRAFNVHSKGNLKVIICLSDTVSSEINPLYSTHQHEPLMFACERKGAKSILKLDHQCTIGFRYL